MFNIKRVFSKKSAAVPSTSKSFRIPDPMLKLLNDVAEEEGETLNALVVLVLDQYLQVKLEGKQVEPPGPEAKTS